METHFSTDKSYRTSGAPRREPAPRDGDSKATTNTVVILHPESDRAPPPTKTEPELLSHSANATETRMSPWAYPLKSAEDRVLAALMLLVSGPLLVLIALAVKIESRGPALIKHLQHSFGGSLVPVWKFRCVSLNGATRPLKGYVIKTAPRLTYVGRFLRASSLEDLPQLISVMCGKISIVGLQPDVPSAESEKGFIFAAVDQCAAQQRFRPGITSLSRVNNWCGGAVSAEAMKKRAEDDLYYINNWSIWLDLWIIVRTIRLVLMEPQAYDSATGSQFR